MSEVKVLPSPASPKSSPPSSALGLPLFNKLCSAAYSFFYLLSLDELTKSSPLFKCCSSLETTPVVVLCCALVERFKRFSMKDWRFFFSWFTTVSTFFCTSGSSLTVQVLMGQTIDCCLPPKHFLAPLTSQVRASVVFLFNQFLSMKSE